ncbi:hypothetical protein FRC03_003979 [Tulasnella sp. 419]|nr:hypothetical protein FRC02_009247 [Tulasnella sp. 418]KAG8962610.1 hypothetical protein FRC03_003979 [Tulasnella sp. 419]
MNRQSTLSSRPSTFGGSSRNASSSQAVMARVLEKRQEWEAIAALDETTTEIVQTLEALAAQSDLIADGGKAIASVMANWPNVLRIIGLFGKERVPTTGEDETETRTDPSAETESLPRLVRIPMDGLAQGTS